MKWEFITNFVNFRLSAKEAIPVELFKKLKEVLDEVEKEQKEQAAKALLQD